MKLSRFCKVFVLCISLFFTASYVQANEPIQLDPREKDIHLEEAKSNLIDTIENYWVPTFGINKLNVMYFVGNIRRADASDEPSGTYNMVGWNYSNQEVYVYPEIFNLLLRVQSENPNLSLVERRALRREAEFYLLFGVLALVSPQSGQDRIYEMATLAQSRMIRRELAASQDIEASVRYGYDPNFQLRGGDDEARALKTTMEFITERGGALLGPNAKNYPYGYLICREWVHAQFVIGYAYSRCTAIRVVNDETMPGARIEFMPLRGHAFKAGLGFGAKVGLFRRTRVRGTNSIKDFEGYFLFGNTSVTVFPIFANPGIEWFTVGLTNKDSQPNDHSDTKRRRRPIGSILGLEGISAKRPNLNFDLTPISGTLIKLSSKDFEVNTINIDPQTYRNFRNIK